jgi:hypothetical protein
MQLVPLKVEVYVEVQARLPRNCELDRLGV